MRGVVFTGERGLELTWFPDPTPEAHEVVIEMKASGMCGSDLHQNRRPGEGGEVHIDVSPHLLRRQLTLVASWTFSNIIQADCARFSVERGIDVDKLFTHRWSIDRADEAYKLFDRQVDGKGVFLM